MAVRIHLTALREANADEVRRVFTEILGPGFGQVEFVEHGGWLWFLTSVWGVKASDLHDGVKRLGAPGLNVTSEDGQRWYLSLFGAGLDPTHLLHDFCYLGGSPEDESGEQPEKTPVDPRLAFLEDDPPPPGPPWIPFDQIIGYYEGLWSKATAEPFRPQAEGLPLDEAFRRFKEWHCGQMADALAARGFGFDRARLLDILRMDSLKEIADGDLGNLPWFLDALGLGGTWSDSVHEAEERHLALKAQLAAEAEAAARGEPPAEEPEPEPDDGEGDEAAQALRALLSDPRPPLRPLAEGLNLPLKETLSELLFLVSACTAGDSPPAALIVAPPAGHGVAPPKKSAHYQVQAEGVQVAVGFANPWLLTSEGFGQKEQGKDLIRFLAELPDGTALEFAAGALDEPGSWQRYAGQIEAGRWRLTATAPPLTGAVLAEALALARTRSNRKVVCRDDAEAEAIMEAVRRDDYLHCMDAKRAGLEISCAFDFGQLAALLFRQRFAAHWDVAVALAKIEAEHAERMKEAKELRKRSVQAAKAFAAPHEADILFEGQASRYWRSSWDRFEDLDEELRQRLEEGLAALAFTELGAFVCKRLRNDIRRVWLAPDRLSYAVAVASRFGVHCQEFVSFFADGSSLTTTTDGDDSLPELGIYQKAVD